MDKKECFRLGQITKPFGIKGEVIIYLDVDTPEKYAGLNSIYIDSKDGLHEKKVEHVRIKQNYAYVKLENINRIEETEIILKCEVFMPLSFLPHLGEKNFYLHEIVGFSVHDAVHGTIGKIENIMDMPAQRLLQINTGKQEILIPVNADFIEKVDRTNKTLYLKTPEGLINVYLSPDSEEN